MSSTIIILCIICICCISSIIGGYFKYQKSNPIDCEMSEWSKCTNGNQTRTLKTEKSLYGKECIDKNLSQSCKNCEMSEWTKCINGNQSRTIKTEKSLYGEECIDKNLSQSCKNCEMSEWSDCVNNKQTRTVKTEKSLYGEECIDKNLSQSCIPTVYVKTIMGSGNTKYLRGSYKRDGNFIPILDIIGVPDSTTNNINVTGTPTDIKFEKNPNIEEGLLVIRNNSTNEILGPLNFNGSSIETRKIFAKEFNTTWKNLDNFNFVEV